MADPVAMSRTEALRREGRAITGPTAAEDFNWLMGLVGGSRFVLLGEATHGTHEFYAARAAITMRLIREKGFNAIAVEADWPDAYRVNRYVRHASGDELAEDALADFVRFPRWMWRNAEVVELIAELRDHNERLPPRLQVGFYGLDLYSLHGSMAAVVRYLEGVDPEAAERARRRYGCFDHFSPEGQAYGYAAALGLSRSCEDQVVAVLRELRRSAADYLSRDGMLAEDELFTAQQNARLAHDAEQYYRQMYLGDVSSWNLRDRHMAATLESLATHLRDSRGAAKVVVWEHNSHLGDARATSMGRGGELNVGQLVRESHGDDAVLVGFTTHSGTVAAASAWDGPVEHKRLNPGREGSLERLLHEVGVGDAGWVLRSEEASRALAGPMLERAVGVVYRPESELQSHYFMAEVSRQFDALIHFDRSRAVEPLDREAGWEIVEAPETYPTGL